MKRKINIRINERKKHKITEEKEIKTSLFERINSTKSEEYSNK